MSFAVCAILETADGKLKKSAAEVMGEGRRVANALGGNLDAMLIGSDTTALAEEAATLGADRVLVADHADLASFTLDGYLKPCLKGIAASTPKVVILAASVTGKDLAPAIAAPTSSGLLTDVTAIEVVDGAVTAKKPVYAGKATATIGGGSADCVVVTIRPNVFEPAAAEAGRTAPIEALEYAGADGIRTIVKEVLAKASEKLDLTEADIIVSGGRGMKGPENWPVLEKLADAVGGVLGASRAVVDAGWREHEEQVGQTGKTVSPKLYIACGISGAIQHLAGMRTSKCIVAINTDAEAPIFKIADYGIVGDLFEVVPVLTEELVKLRS
ncbi:MAG: electron transfer flavoprotein subunit alpha/FixB family protein [Planctomycetota bacterium]